MAKMSGIIVVLYALHIELSTIISMFTSWFNFFRNISTAVKFLH